MELNRINRAKKGIYLILNLVNKKVYVGKTEEAFGRRKSRHFSSLKKGIHSNNYLQKSWNKYGEENFLFLVIQELDGKELDYIYQIETAWIKIYNSANRSKGYNILEEGGSASGYKHPKGIFAGKNNPMVKISDDILLKIKKEILEDTNLPWYKREIEISKKYNLSRATIGRIRDGKHYANSTLLHGGYKEWIKEGV